MADKLKLNEIWINIDGHSVTFLNENFEKMTYAHVEFLVTSILDKEKFMMETFEDNNKQKSPIIKYNEADPHKHLEIRLRKNSTYELLLFVYDAEEKQFIYRNKLSKTELELIPKELVALMERVKELDRPISFYNP